MVQIVLNDVFIQDFIPVLIDFLEKKDVKSVKVIYGEI